MSTCAPVQNHEPAEEGKQGEEEKEKEKEKEEMKEPQSEERAEEKTEKEQKKEEKKEPGKKEKGKEDELQGSWKDFFYNPRTGEVLGRTASSWGKISRLSSGRSGFDLSRMTRTQLGHLGRSSIADGL